jgi:hypothetical protein
LEHGQMTFPIFDDSLSSKILEIKT